MEKKRARSTEGGNGEDEGLVSKKAKSLDPRFGTCEYSGWTPKKGDKIDRVELSSLTPETFFKQYVAQRKPVVIVGFINDPKWKATEWTLQHLSNKAGDCRLKIEYRDNSSDRYGLSKEERMRFSEFLKGISEGDDLHYLTTQDLARDPEGRPEIIAPPLTHIVDEFPLRPELTGRLVPANINLWIGNSKEGSLSGLHHDYHDNLYILLKGRKRFDLFCPAETHKMYTKGSDPFVHFNGLINYSNSGIIRADGAEESAEVAAKADQERKAAELEVARAEEAVEAGEPGAEERLAAAEERLERALDGVLNAEMEGEGDDFDEEGMDDFEGEDDFEEEEEEEEEGSKKKKNNNEKEKQKDEEEEEGVKKQKETPINFSLVDITKSVEEKAKQWPRFLEAVALECEVKEGEMLFLPAGWFHNVTSFSAPSNSEKEKGATYHMAFNYWFHPPDSFEDHQQPYKSDFWEQDWKARGL